MPAEYSECPFIFLRVGSGVAAAYYYHRFAKTKTFAKIILLYYYNWFCHNIKLFFLFPIIFNLYRMPS